MRFWDSSALFALIAPQECSPVAASILASDAQAATWWGTPVELASAAARLRTMGEIDDAGYASIASKIGPLALDAEEVQPSEEVRQTALRLIRTHNLRASDSLQLAAALVWARHVPAGLEFVCMDARLRAAAEKEGFSVLG